MGVQIPGDHAVIQALAGDLVMNAGREHVRGVRVSQPVQSRTPQAASIPKLRECMGEGGQLQRRTIGPQEEGAGAWRQVRPTPGS